MLYEIETWPDKEEDVIRLDRNDAIIVIWIRIGKPGMEFLQRNLMILKIFKYKEMFTE